MKTYMSRREQASAIGTRSSAAGRTIPAKIAAATGAGRERWRTAADGWSAQVRAALGRSEPRLVALTGFNQGQDRERTRAAGFDAHLAKPIDVSRLPTRAPS